MATTKAAPKTVAKAPTKKTKAVSHDIILTEGYTVVLFDGNGMPRCVGYSSSFNGAIELRDEHINHTDIRAHIYPLPGTDDNIHIYKYTGV